MADVLLVQPPIRDYYLTRKRTLPYGLVCLAATLREAGFAVELLDGLATGKTRTIDPPPEMGYLNQFYGRPDLSPFGLFYHYHHYGYGFETIGRAAKASGAFLVGIASLFSPYYQEVLMTAKSVKEHHPSCKIVLGGHHPTCLPQEAMQSRAVDFIIRGEAEEALPLLARALRSKDIAAINAIPGIVYRNAQDRLHIGEPAIANDLDKNPLPATDLIKANFYRRNKKASITITASRGCPMSCSYCCVGCAPHLSFRKRRVASIVAEIASQNREERLGMIDFEDENLSFDRKWFLSLLTAVAACTAHDKPELRAMNGLLPSSLDAEIVAAMQAAGFRTLNLSLGTASRDQLRRFRRPDMRRAFDHGLGLAEQYGLKAVAYIIAAAPFQTPQDSVADLIYLAARRVLAGVSIFYPAPGSADFDLCQQLGLLPNHPSLWRSSVLPLVHTTNRLEAVTILRLGRVLNFMKYLIDNSTSLPSAAIPPKQLSVDVPRDEIGRLLLAGFLKDGHIRGVTPRGEVYRHNISKTLTRLFLDGLAGVTLRGSLK
jgi:radical SAM superfamily enzyme YgiQ (UPF0313 family)